MLLWHLFFFFCSCRRNPEMLSWFCFSPSPFPSLTLSLSLDGKESAACSAGNCLLDSFFSPGTPPSVTQVICFSDCVAVKRDSREGCDHGGFSQSGLCTGCVLVQWFLSCRQGEIASMYERHKRKYSFCAKGERTVDVVLIKVGRCVCIDVCDYTIVIIYDYLNMSVLLVNGKLQTFCWSSVDYLDMFDNKSDIPFIVALLTLFKHCVTNMDESN